MNKQKINASANGWSDFGHGVICAFGLDWRKNRFHPLYKRTERSTWEVVGEILADAMNDYGAAIRKQNPHAKLPPRAEPVAGSLPDPDILAHYERLQPGSADQILAMAENHLRQQTRGVAAGHQAFLRPYTLGLLAGTAIVVTILIACFWLVSEGHWLPGMVGLLLVAAITAGQFRVASGR